jgi:HK97 family phage major capsid protein
MSEEIKKLIEDQGAAFDAFKKTHDELKKSDVVTAEKLARIEKSLDDAVEAKAAIERRLETEKKEREDLELRMQKMGVRATGEAEAKRELNLKEFNNILAANSADRKRANFTPLDQKGYDDYRAAHERFCREGKEALTPDELKTLSAGSDPDGGYFVTPDSTGRIVSKVYETSPMRQYASIQVISTDKLEGIEDNDEAGAGYAGEHATSGNTDTPEVGKWSIPVFWIDTEPKATQQLLDDAAVNIEAWLSGKVADKFARFENNEFVTGAANKIRGFAAGYTFAADSGSGVTWGSIGYVATGVDGDFAASAKGDKLYDLMGTLKNAYLGNAAWFTRRSVITDIRKFKDGQNNYLWQPSFIAGQPETIMGYPVARMEDIPAKGSSSYSLFFGDMGAAYQIVDRAGIRVLRDNLTSKPYVKFYTTKRVGGGMVNFEAIKAMKFYTS